MGEKEGGDTLIFGWSWPLACDSAPLPTCTVYMELSLPILDLIFFREAKPNLHHAERSWRICRHVHPQVNINMLWTRRKCEFITCDVLILFTSYCTGTDFILWHVICRKCSDSNRILSARDHASIQVYWTPFDLEPGIFCHQLRTLGLLMTDGHLCCLADEITRETVHPGQTLCLHCGHMGPHLRDLVPMGTLFSFWVPISVPRSPFSIFKLMNVWKVHAVTI